MKYPHLNCGCFYKDVMIGVLDCPITVNEDQQHMIRVEGYDAPVFASAMYMRDYMSGTTDNAMQGRILQTHEPQAFQAIK